MFIPETQFPIKQSTLAQRLGVRALAGLEVGVLGGLATEIFLLAAAFVSGWGWPTWAGAALHIVIWGFAGMGAAAVARKAVRWPAAFALGVAFAISLQWLVERFIWIWLRRILPEQAPGWAYWSATIALGFLFALIPARARSYERGFLLK